MKLVTMILLAGIGAAAQTTKPVVGVAGILHESNSFCTLLTSLDMFKREQPPWAASNDEITGFLEGSAEHGLEVYLGINARATPAGPVTAEAFEALSAELIKRLVAAPRLDGLLLALHGAMFSEKFPHADAEILRRVRAALGEKLPIVVTHDYHANIPPDLVKYSTALLTYQSNPHIDQKVRGRKAAGILAGILRGEYKPTQALAKPGMLYNIRFQNTNLEPLLPVVEESRRIEKEPGVLAVSVSGGYQYGDVPHMGASVVVVTNNQPERAREIAERLSKMLWETRGKLQLNVPPPADAVRQAMGSDRFPVVLVEMGDNIGGGSTGDATFLLSELISQKAQGWVVAIADPGAVQLAAKAGVGGVFDAPVGGKMDNMHGRPVRIRGQVKSLHDGRFRETEIRHGGRTHYDQGLTAVIELEGSTRELQTLLMLTTERMVPFSIHQLVSCGIYPERQRILVVKAAVAFRAAYEPVAGKIIEVNTGGVTAIDPRQFTYQRVPATLFGMQP
jgi:microcystin degradation protein MlrC